MRRSLLAAAGVALIVWIFYIGATWGPRPVDSQVRERVENVDITLVEESRQLAREFEAIAAQRDPSEAELNLLREAFEKQRTFNLAGSPTTEDRRRQEELERRIAHFDAKKIHEQSLSAEREAQLLVADGDVHAAVAKTEQAFELQKQINQQFGRTAFRDPAREGRLQQQLASMAAEPLHARSVELEQQADEAEKESRWADARSLLTESRELQKRVNEMARRSSFYDTNRYQELANKIASLEIGEKVSEVLRLQQEGEQQEQAGRSEEAAQLFERAMVLQNEINREHPQSRFVSTERVAELDAARQTALSARQAATLNEALAAMRRAIASGDFSVAGEKIEEAGPLAAQVAERFPRSRYASFEVQMEVNYLALVRESLPELQQLLRENLLPIPGQEPLKMSGSLVSQKVFSRIMNFNPSRNRGENLPVDSVTLEQAQEFCLRASWILGQSVQLPGEEHFKAALGAWDPETYRSLSWHKENSEGVSHPVSEGRPNQHGFVDLVGNLRSWIRKGGENGFLTAGASFADEFPQTDLFQLIDRDLRDQTIGFRYVVGTETF